MKLSFVQGHDLRQARQSDRTLARAENQYAAKRSQRKYASLRGFMTDAPHSAPQSPENLSILDRARTAYQANRRRIGTVAAILVALLLAWHAVNGRNGLSSWQQKRAEDKALAQEIEQLTAENAHLSQHVDRLKSDPGAIEYEARLRLRYARPNEIIYALPPTPDSSKAAPATK